MSALATTAPLVVLNTVRYPPLVAVSARCISAALDAVWCVTDSPTLQVKRDLRTTEEIQLVRCVTLASCLLSAHISSVVHEMYRK